MSEQAAIDLGWLDVAARLATPMLGATGATPPVCALLVDPENDRLLSQGVTPFRGVGVAELLALADAPAADGTTLYLTAEPVPDVTGPASAIDAIVNAGVSRVVAGALDADPARAGEGLRRLAELGIDVHYLAHERSALLHEGARSRQLRGRPHVTLKITLSADDMVGHGAPGGHDLLGVEALRWLDRERAAADAIISGAARAEIENADLLTHLPGLDRRGALRVILAGQRDLNTGIDLFNVVSGAPILVVTTAGRPSALRPGIEVAEIEQRRGHLDLRQVLDLLTARQINRVLVEAGARLAESFIAGEMVDRLHVVDIPGLVGRSGVRAALLGRFQDRIAAARFSEVDRRLLGEDKVRTFERL
ncbi:MAG: hypothetical protein EOP22_00010 [Hyphomicrobiales bacterium]|nr:MAG: hypothetical protein EOP22_00010 [Hyphomicrobiales bacterium]